MASAAGGKQQPGLLSAMASLNPFAKSKSERKGPGRPRIDAVPLSFDMNGTGAAQAEQPKPPESQAADPTPRESEASEGVAGGDEPAAEGVAPKTTVGVSPRSHARDRGFEEDALMEMSSTDTELGYPAVLIISYWKAKEERKFITHRSKPPVDYVMHRRYMVDWMSEVGEQLDLQTVTIHSAVSFLDELMVILRYNHRHWKLHAVCCLSVAAKYEEAECNMPMISELADATDLSLTTPMVTRGELELVQRLKWDVSRVTAMHFLGYYTDQGVTMADDRCQGRKLVDKVVRYMNKYVEFFANLCQQHYRFQHYLPSHLAAVAVLAARRALCISPRWRDELTVLTGYTLEEVAACGDELWSFYEQMFPTHKPLRTDTSGKKTPQTPAAAAAAATVAAPTSGTGVNTSEASVTAVPAEAQNSA